MTTSNPAALHRRVKALRSEVARVDDAARAGAVPRALIDTASELRRLLPRGSNARNALERLFETLDERPELCNHPGAVAGILRLAQNLLRDPRPNARDDVRATRAIDRQAADLRFLKTTRSALGNAASLTTSRVPDFADLDAYATWAKERGTSHFGRGVMDAALALIHEGNPRFTSASVLASVAGMYQCVHDERRQGLASLASLRAALKADGRPVDRDHVRACVASVSDLASEAVALEKAVALASAAAGTKAG